MIRETLWDREAYIERPMQYKTTKSIAPATMRRIYNNLDKLRVHMTPMDLHSYNYFQRALRTFERSSSEIRGLSIDHFERRYEGDIRKYMVIPVNGRKNTGFKNRNNPRMKPYEVMDGQKYFASLTCYFRKRGTHIKDRAFYLKPFPKFRVCLYYYYMLTFSHFVIYIYTEKANWRNLWI